MYGLSPLYEIVNNPTYNNKRKLMCTEPVSNVWKIAIINNGTSRGQIKPPQQSSSRSLF